MISFVPSFSHNEAEKASLEHVVDHIEHAAAQIGYHHIGLGSDYDGMEKAVTGLEDVSKYPQLVLAMLNRGIARPDIEKIIGLNLIRVLSEVGAVAKSSREARKPALEDVVKQLWNDDIRAYVRSVYPEKPKTI
jgi:membrane dipeptidase